jgi:hypothetical protein
MPRASNAVTKKDLEQFGVTLAREIRSSLREDLAVEGDKWRASFHTLEVRFDTLEGRFGTLGVRFETLEGRFLTLEGRFLTLEEQVHHHGVLFEAFQSTVHGRFEGVIAATDRLTAEVAELRRRFDLHDFDSLERRVTTLEKKAVRRS